MGSWVTHLSILFLLLYVFFFFSSRRRHTRCLSDWSSDVCSSDLGEFTRMVPIDTMPLGIVRLSPKQVTVTGDMGRIAERSFGGIPVETGAGAITSRSEERRVGKECRSRWGREHWNKELESE